jgi:hypothetical protein
MSSTDEKHGISVEHEHGSPGSDTDTKPAVPVGHGAAAKLEGAKTRKVYNVSYLSSRPSTPS